MVIPDAPQNLIGDSAYDSDKLDADRYRRRWKVERLFAWLQNFRCVVIRYERYAENFLGMLPDSAAAFMRWLL
jgi:transposase